MAFCFHFTIIALFLQHYSRHSLITLSQPFSTPRQLAPEPSPPFPSLPFDSPPFPSLPLRFPSQPTSHVVNYYVNESNTFSPYFSFTLSPLSSLPILTLLLPSLLPPSPPTHTHTPLPPYPPTPPPSPPLI